jgi:hypothetical protein
MARRSIRERPDREEVLWPVQTACPACGRAMRLRYDNYRTLVTLSGPVRLRLKIRRCEAVDARSITVPIGRRRKARLLCRNTSSAWT